ncbi:MAG: hypothetical protein R3F61_06670 [Myxococcota bacterium]
MYLVLVGVFGASGLGAAVYRTLAARQARRTVLPTVPSHANALEGPTEPSTRFFAAVHELTMTVTEAWNAGRARDSVVGVEEAVRRDALQRCRQELELAAADLRVQLDPYEHVYRAAERARAATGKLWRRSSTDHFQTTQVSFQLPDGSNQTLEQETYRHTEHDFHFTSAEVPAAEQAVRAVVAAMPSQWPRLAHEARRVELTALAPAERSFLERLVTSTVGEDADVGQVVNQWIHGTRLDARLGVMVGAASRLVSRVDAWADANRTARSGSVVSTNPQEIGHPGYRETVGITQDLEVLAEQYEAIDTVVRTALEAAHTLERWATDRALVERDEQYLEQAARAYQLVFPDSTLSLVPRVKDANPWVPVAAGAGTGLVSFVLYGWWMLF